MPDRSPLPTLVRAALLAAALACAAVAGAQTSPELAYDNLVADVLASVPEARNKVAREWFATNPRLPILRGNGSTIFVYFGPAEDVGLLGDMTAWRNTLPMRRVGRSDLWVREATFEPDARLDYRFSVDGRWLADPFNPLTSESDFGTNNVWAGRRHAAPVALDGPPPARRGKGTSFELGERTVHVHLPPNYNDNPTRRFPVVYAQDGTMMRDTVELPRAADQLVGEGRLAPVILVLIQVDDPLLEYLLSDAYVAWVGDTLVAEIDRRYRTIRHPSARLLLGVARGGLATLATAAARPDTFDKVATISAFASYRDDAVIARLRDLPPRAPLSFFVEVGTYESWVAGEDYLAANRRLHAVLAARNFPTHYEEFAQGHAWGFWRERAPAALLHFFPAARAAPDPRHPEATASRP